jgi:hypothetical protein
MKTRYSIILRLLITFFISAFPILLLSQETTTCAENLRNATALFDRGQIDQVPTMLQECMKSGFKREEQLAAFKLLIQSYLFEDKIEKADSTMFAFLNKYPEYQLSPTDHSSFVFLFNTFKVKPVIQVAVHLGTNVPFLTFIGPNTHSSKPRTTNYGSGALNPFISLEAKFTLTPKLEINVEGAFSQLSFTNIENFLDFGKTKYIERQSRIEIPVSVTYNFKSFGKFTLFGRGGAGSAMNLAISAKPTFDPLDLNNFDKRSGADIDRMDSRIFLDLFAQAGAGIKFKTPGGYIFFEARSDFGFFNQVIEGKNSSEHLKWDYYYADDKFHMNNMNFNLGYTQIFYKPSKRK